MEQQLEAFCEREYPRLVGLLRLYCGDEQAALDLAQEALVRAVAHWPRVRRMDAPGGWTYRVAINLANSWFRRRATGRRAHERLRAQAAVAGETARSDLDEALAVRAALTDLPGRQREAVVLCHLLGMDADEVARLMGCTPQAVRNLTHRARRQLRETLAALEEVDDVR